jgi:hypothetical protein
MKNALCAWLALLAAAPAGAQIPNLMSHHGRLFNADDTPVNGTVRIVFKISKNEHRASEGSSETLVWSQVERDVQVFNGSYSTVLGGDTNPLGPASSGSTSSLRAASAS